MKTLFVVLALGLVTGCNTFEGMGEDIQAGGHAISKSADKTKDEMSK